MKYTKLFVGAMLMASAAVAGAADFNKTFTIDLSAGPDVLTGDFGNAYAAANLKGLTFEDTYNFTLPSFTNVDAGLQSVSTTIKGVKTAGIQFTSFDLYAGSTLLAKGDVGTFGTLSLGGLSFEGAQSAGIYTLKVDGKFTGTSGGSYSGNVNISPVPEPETWGMTVSGLAAVAFLARRRKASAIKAA